MLGEFAKAALVRAVPQNQHVGQGELADDVRQCPDGVMMPLVPLEAADGDDPAGDGGGLGAGRWHCAAVADQDDRHVPEAGHAG